MWELLAGADGPKLRTVVLEPVVPSTSCRRLEYQLSRLLTGTIGSTRAPVDDGH
jgi:hypothetical protein